MKFHIEKLGVIQKAEFDIGKLTLICGKNNTGKTYITHAVYGFLNYLHSALDFPVSKEQVEQLYKDGAVILPLSDYAKNIQKFFDKAAQKYSKNLFRIFAGERQSFSGASFRLELDSESSSVADVTSDIHIRLGSVRQSALKITTTEDRESLKIRLHVKPSEAAEDNMPTGLIKDMIVEGIRSVLLGNLIPDKPFLASTERTGAAIFQRELDFTRNRIVETLGETLGENIGKNLKSRSIPPQLVRSFSAARYPLAIRDNVDFIRSLPDLASKNSFIVDQHPDIIRDFSDIIGGKYQIEPEGQIRFVPTDSRHKDLPLATSSSAVRALLIIGFYLKHQARKGDWLMIDEPELNLHPENQRRLARLFARLIKVGIKIFVTTHSDYLIAECNTLLMLQQGDTRLKALAKREGYTEEELLSPQDVRVYVAENQGLTSAQIDAQSGIDVPSFDDTIEEMNRIQDEIIWGERD